MMSRPFTFREKLLLIIMTILIIAVLYFKFVYLDVSSTIADAPQNMSNAQNGLTFEQTKNQSLKNMQMELSGDKQEGRQMSLVPDYDNLQKLMSELNGILIKAENYTVSFMPLSQQDNIVRREMQLSFTCGGYKTAEDIVESIRSSRYRNIITSLSMTSKNENINSGNVSVNMSVTYFELGKAVKDDSKTKDDTSALN
jgi:hypothetical protein